MVKRFLIVFISFIIILANLCGCICYATAIKVTKDNLKIVFQELENANIDEHKYKFTVSDESITVKVDEDSYIMKYDLKNKPTFIYETEIKKGMSYKEYTDKTNGSASTLLGYLAVLKIQGIEFKEASEYYGMCLLEEFISGITTTEKKNPYTIVDDMNLDEGVTIKKDNTDSKTIYTSEFGNRIMEYINSEYEKATSFNDEKLLNSFEMITERKDVTDTSCKLVTMLTINTDADFSKVKEYSEKLTKKESGIESSNADYVIKLKVGQKCTFKTDEKIVASSISGSDTDIIEFSEDRKVITAKKVGNVDGFICIGNSENKKSIYVTVEENKDNQQLETITLNIDNISKQNENNTNVEKEVANNVTIDESRIKVINSNSTEKNETNTQIDNTSSKGILPKTGKNQILIGSIFLCTFIGIIYALKYKSYNDVK